MVKNFLRYFLSISFFLLSGAFQAIAHSAEDYTSSALFNTSINAVNDDAGFLELNDISPQIKSPASSPEKNDFGLDATEVEEEDERLKSVRKSFVYSYYFSALLYVQLNSNALDNSMIEGLTRSHHFSNSTSKSKHLLFQVFLI